MHVIASHQLDATSDRLATKSLLWAALLGGGMEKNAMGGACSTFRSVYRVLVGKPEGKRPLGRPRGRWEDNIKMVLQEVLCGFMGWIELAKERDRWLVLVNGEWTFRLHKMRGIFWLGEILSASLEALSSLQSVSQYCCTSLSSRYRCVKWLLFNVS